MKVTTPAKEPKPAVFPFLDLKAQYRQIRDEVRAAVDTVLEDQRFILGPEVEKFEKTMAEYVGTPFALGCASGSDALLLALMGLGVGRGDEVITVPFTFVATAGAIARLGARTVFVDIDPETYNLDPAKLEAAITPRTKAIIPVHLFGLAVDMDAVMDIARRHKIPVVEDAAQAIGARYNGKPVGSIGAVGCFSFFPSKNLGGAGDGGLLTCSDRDLADRLQVLRVHGSPRRYEYQVVGTNSRLDAMQAAILRVKAKYLDSWAEGRRRNADLYRSLFEEYGLTSLVKPPTEPAGYHHVYNQFTIRVQNRDALKQYLQAEGVPTEIYYPFPLHTQPAFLDLGYKDGDLPVSERASREVLSLPIYPELKPEQLRTVVSAIAAFFRQNR